MKSMAVALGGAIGAVLRYSIGVLTAGSGTFPYGTVTVNLAGSFGIALAYCFFSKSQFGAAYVATFCHYRRLRRVYDVFRIFVGVVTDLETGRLGRRYGLRLVTRGGRFPVLYGRVGRGTMAVGTLKDRKTGTGQAGNPCSRPGTVIFKALVSMV